MSNFGAILTNAGAAKLSNAIALGVPLKLTQMAVGDGNGQPVAPDPAMTAIPGETRRAAINTLFPDPLAASQLVAEQIIPEDVGGWWIRCVGLYDDSNTLIAIANVPDTYKPLLASGAGRTQIIRMVLIVSDTSAVELKIDPSVVLATRKYVDDVMKAHKESRDHPGATKEKPGMLRLATEAEALAGLLNDVAVAPKEMHSAIEFVLDAVAPIGLVLPWVGETPPNSRFVIVKNQTFDPVALPKLAKIFPAGRIPFDPRGLGLRFWDGGRGRDPGRAILSEQGDAMRNITGYFGNCQLNPSLSYAGPFSPELISQTLGLTTAPPATGNGTVNFKFDTSKVVPTASEFRGASMALSGIMRVS
ncbi:phage tail protein [Aeromonas veronii]|uniref:phage tail protein n=1 Tax=Aeromonas veronii TaxID=654 RepID=UPI0040557B57